MSDEQARKKGWGWRFFRGDQEIRPDPMPITIEPDRVQQISTVMVFPESWSKEEADAVREGIALAFVAKPNHRYKGVWLDGYRAALADLKAGRLVLRDGKIDIGVEAFK